MRPSWRSAPSDHVVVHNLLAPEREPLQAPLRAELFGPQRFAQHGHSLADTHAAQTQPFRSTTFAPRLRSNIAHLREAHQVMAEQASQGHDISPAAEWLLDNFHLIEAQVQAVHDELPHSYFKKLPLLQEPPLAGLPRVYGLAWAFVAHTDSTFDVDLLQSFLSAYMEHRALDLAELWALPTTMRVVLIENLRRLAERVATQFAATDLANQLADRPQALSLEQLERLVEQLERRGVATSFISQLLQRLNSDEPSTSWDSPEVVRWLQYRCPQHATLLSEHIAEQTADNLSVSNAVRSLRAIGDADWKSLIAHISPLMRLMLAEPLFAAEDTPTRNRTLHALEQLTRRAKSQELDVAQALLQHMHPKVDGQPWLSTAQHWLHGAGRVAFAKDLGLRPHWSEHLSSAGLRSSLYIGSIVLATCIAVGWSWPEVSPPFAVGLLLGVAMFLTWSEVVTATLNRLICESIKPHTLPRVAFRAGVPAEHRVLVVIPVLLSDICTSEAVLHRLYLHHLANPDSQAQFALLSDWSDAATSEQASDAGLLADMLQRLQALNAQAAPLLRIAADLSPPPRFIVLHRIRSYNAAEGCWMGWERKRGKLHQLLHQLATGEVGAFLDLGLASQCASGVAHVLTLDSDTELPPGRLRELLGVAAHPSNAPVLSPEGRGLLHGWSILQPRVVAPLVSPHHDTRYHRLMSCSDGLDPYTAASSDVYQDVFEEGSFSGKGMLNVQAVHALLHQRLPHNQVLSHDLLEGALARCAALSDLTLVEEAPHHVAAAAARLSRWTRGDWQLLPFIVRAHHHGLGAIQVWKMLDNLRRSLLPIAALVWWVLSLAGWGAAPLTVICVVAAAFGAGPLIGAMTGLVSRRRDLAWRHFLHRGWTELCRALAVTGWHLATLPASAWLSLDAMVRALYRQGVSKRHLLQWTTAAEATRTLSGSPSGERTQQALMSAFVLLACALGAWAGTRHLDWLLACAVVWWAMPLSIWWVNQPSSRHDEAPLNTAERQALTQIARETWRYFERWVGPEDRHLPPDNLQTNPQDALAHRTSPTNIGLYLLSIACARQWGWLGTEDLLARIEATLSSMASLPHHRGHLMNWTDTRSGVPLPPLYVSTVDSGNLAGHLLTVAQACLALATKPYASEATVTAQAAARQEVSRRWPARHEGGLARQQLRDAIADAVCTRDSARRDAHALACGLAPQATERLREAAHVAQQQAQDMDFSLLYHPQRSLFHIGFRVAESELDPGFFDLLASEASLSSLLAIAKGDVPVTHWRALGRPFFAAGTRAGLMSWSGSMFEYLMPRLVLPAPEGSVLHDAALTALDEQRAYSHLHRVPWGISESAFAGRDHTLAYQYAPQGVPRLALRRTPPDNLVIAPYATALAAMLAPRLALHNFEALQRLGARGRYGFIESLDFSPHLRHSTHSCTLVSTYMAHHQGMTVAALSNALLGGVVQAWGMSHPAWQSLASLLHERSPRAVSHLGPLKDKLPQRTPSSQSPGLVRDVSPGTTAMAPTHLLSNGRYRVSLRPNGAGWSRWGMLGLTRWRDDALRDAYGSFLYLQRTAQQAPVSLTQHPAPDPSAHYRCHFHADRVIFEAQWEDLQVRTTVWVAPEDDIEFRQTELLNLSDQSLSLSLMSAFEPTVTDERADEDHPAFSNLFLRAEWLSALQALRFTRGPRLQGDTPAHLVHFLADRDPFIKALRYQTRRVDWRGRNRDQCRALAALNTPPTTDEALDTGLDPVCVLAADILLPAGSRARLTWATAASADDAVLNAVIDKYRQAPQVQRASLLSSTLAVSRLHSMSLGAEPLAALQTLTTALVLSLSRTEVNAPRVGRLCDRRQLWRFGLSGERPMLLVTVATPAGLGLLRTLSQALRLWAWGGVACDLVVCCSEPASYHQTVQHDVAALIESYTAEQQGMGAQRPGFFLLRAEDVTQDELDTLRSLARLHLYADGRPLAYHLHMRVDRHELAMKARQSCPSTALPLAPYTSSIGVAGGEFAEDGSGEFRFAVNARLRPQRPWINVLANERFGAQCSEGGGGYTWAVNSRLLQLTGWSNDPVCDPVSEWWWLQDKHSQSLWPLMPTAHSPASLSYEVVHGQGYTCVRHQRDQLKVRLTWCVDTEDAVKQVQVHLQNLGSQTLHLRLIGVAEWLMGAKRSDRNTVSTALFRQRLDPEGHTLSALLCTQSDRSGDFGGHTAYLAVLGEREETGDWTCDRRECFDARGQAVIPDHFGQSSGDGLDPCAALCLHLTLQSGQTLERSFLLGHANSAEGACTQVVRAATLLSTQRLSASRQRWNTLLKSTEVLTPDPLFDALVNRWLPYQAVVCRLWSKAGFYQAGGATGFRDQLQDAMALTWADPALLREQVLRCVERQFPEGDVQHWWHAPSGAGVRTHCSDDLLWLPLACAHYVRATNDHALLEERRPFLMAPILAVGAQDAYTTPGISDLEVSVYEHAALALDRGLTVGPNGLPLIGGGDWNDGMNQVGPLGRGESVWLGWFLCQVVHDFTPLARARLDDARADRWALAAQGLRQALIGPAWDGRWFRRAFFDDGSTLGSQADTESQIDLIAQAWSVLSGAAPPAMQRMALDAMVLKLADPQAGLMRLLDPPRAESLPSPGYIQAYPPGVRENGGQYSHAAIWGLMALARAQQQAATWRANGADQVWRLFTWLSPAHRSAHASQSLKYGLEPYVMAGDICSQPPYVGVGGWSWYTGSAAWLHRAALESLFGLVWDAQQLQFLPCLPPHWPQAGLVLRRGNLTLHFTFLRVDAAQIEQECARRACQLLPVGATLAWPNSALDSHFLVPLALDSSGTAPTP